VTRAIVLMIALDQFVARSRLGRGMGATSQDPETVPRMACRARLSPSPSEQTTRSSARVRMYRGFGSPRTTDVEHGEARHARGHLAASRSELSEVTGQENVVDDQFDTNANPAAGPNTASRHYGRVTRSRRRLLT
jgi:hypothetical protein